MYYKRMLTLFKKNITGKKKNMKTQKNYNNNNNKEKSYRK